MLIKGVPPWNSQSSSSSSQDLVFRHRRGYEWSLFSVALPSQGGGEQRPEKDGMFPMGSKREIVHTRLQKIKSQLVALKISFIKSFQTKLFDLSQIQRSTKVLISCVLLALAVNYMDISSPISNNGSSSLQQKPIEIPYSKFMDYCEGKTGEGSSSRTMVQIDNVQVDETGQELQFQLLTATTRNEKKALKAYIRTDDKAYLNKLVTLSSSQLPTYSTRIVNTINPEVVSLMRQNNIGFEQQQQQQSQQQPTITKKGCDTDSGELELVPTILIGGIAYKIYSDRNPSSASNKKFGGVGTLVTNNQKKKKVDKSNKSSSSSSSSLASFDDIEGIDDAKADVMELVDTLRNPEKYTLVGARPPTGLLLEGPPGTGKTTLAKACAAMADVPFISVSGSSFVERYVGTGAARVRKLFDQATKINAPCIIFIDEIDALGKARKDGGGGSSGNSDESEQTLNQLLACMDGLEDNTSSSDDSKSLICVLGATNRKDVLDPALIRPGRFDRIVKVGLPNLAGRERILRVHTKRLSGFAEGLGIDPSRENR